MLGLTYNFELADLSLMRPGLVNISDMSHFASDYTGNGFGRRQGLGTVGSETKDAVKRNPAAEGFIAYIYGGR